MLRSTRVHSQSDALSGLLAGVPTPVWSMVTLDLPDPSESRSPYTRIKRAIIDRTIEPGSALVEATLAEWCGVSRTPIREALTRLEQDGLAIRSERGLIVRERSPEEIFDLYSARIVLEIEAARSAAERSTSFDRVRLERLVAAAENTDPTDVRELALKNQAFHYGIWEVSRNAALQDLLNRLEVHLLRYPVNTLMYPGRWEVAMKEHRALVGAIVSHDENAAQEIARKHFNDARNIRLELWDEGNI